MRENQNAQQAPSTGRIEQFSDGVFAIVITLLVLSLRVPEIENEANVYDILNALFQLLPKFLGFVMSFFFVAVFWVAHHQYFHTLNLSTKGLLWLNNLFLFFITFVPFPTALLGEYPRNAAAVIFFGASFLLTSLSFAFLRWYGWVKSDITSENFSQESVKDIMRLSFLPPVFYFLGILVALVNTEIAIAIFFITPLILLLPLKLSFDSKKKEDIKL